MATEVQVFDSADAMLDAAADAVVDAAAASIALRGRFTVALAGGSTPKGLYQRLAGAWRDRIDWTRVVVFWGDERCVPPTHPDSNYRMAREALLDHVPIPPSQVHRMAGEADPTAAALDYAATLEATLLPAQPSDGSSSATNLPAAAPGASGGGAPGAFDLVLLGLGDDGHTASLFPDKTAGRETLRSVVAEHVDAARGWRLTLTPPLINRARSTLWLVAGAAKAPALAAVLEGPPAPDEFPAQRITGHDVRWLVDRAAARQLTAPPPA